MKKLATLGLVFFLLSTGSVFAADSIEAGVDLWRTPADGSTFYDFSKQPIPADFFCTGSAPFAQKVEFAGVPLKTSPADALGGIDTVIHRLDKAVFNAHGQTVTRVQAVALSLASVATLKTSCGGFKAVVSLAGEQPTSDMIIVRKSEQGGYFHSALNLQLRITFVPVKGNRSNTLSLDRLVEFPFSTSIPWAYEAAAGKVLSRGLTSVDTNGDGLADTFVPASSNFAAGQSQNSQTKRIIPIGDEQNCHSSYSYGDQHCYYP